jgi:hypothetical protein
MICELRRKMRRQISATSVVLASAGFLAASTLAAARVLADPDAPEASEVPPEVKASLRPTGKVRSVEVQDPGLEIATPTTVFVTGERAVPVAAAPTEPRTVDLQGLKELVGQRLVDERMADLRRCRGEVAIARRVAAQALRAREVLARWTIAFDGRVEDVAVVATAPTDPEVLECVHRKISTWRFVGLPGDPLQVEAPLVFELKSTARAATAGR